MLLNDAAGQKILADYYQKFITIAQQKDVPILLGSPTRQANKERLAAAGINHNVNALAVRFLKYLRAEYDSWADNIFIAGMVSCKNNSHRPHQSLSSGEAVSFHLWQVNQLEREGVDLLMSSPLRCLPEAIGIATAMAVTSTPYVISFLLAQDGRLADGTTLLAAFDEIDSLGLKPPVGYMVNSTAPSLLNARHQPAMVMERLIGFQTCPAPPTSPPNHNRLPQKLDMESWCRQMTILNQRYHVNIMGDSSGPETKYLEALASQLTGRTKISA